MRILIESPFFSLLSCKEQHKIVTSRGPGKCEMKKGSEINMFSVNILLREEEVKNGQLILNVWPLIETSNFMTLTFKWH